MQIDIMNLQKQVRIERKAVTECAEFTLRAMGEEEAELSLLFTDDSRIRRLNRQYRKINSRTDVLAFPMREGKCFSNVTSALGDVVISVETAKREAHERGASLKKEICLYLVHGILHLLGYDDEDSVDRKKMKAKEKELLEAM